MTGEMNLRRLPVPDRRARARPAPQLHGHDDRRARAPGRHARLGRPQRRRDRRRAGRPHLRPPARPARSCATTRDARASRFDDLKRGWGGAQAAHLQAIFAEAAKPNGFGVAYFEGLLGVGVLHSKINLPLKWFLGTYPVLLDLVHDAMLADTPEPARVAKRSLAGSSESVDLAVLHAAERALNRVFNYDSQAIVEAFYYDTFASMGVQPARRWARPARAATSPTCSAPSAHACTRRCRPSAPRRTRSRTCARP